MLCRRMETRFFFLWRTEGLESIRQVYVAGAVGRKPALACTRYRFMPTAQRGLPSCFFSVVVANLTSGKDEGFLPEVTVWVRCTFTLISDVLKRSSERRISRAVQSRELWSSVFYFTLQASRLVTSRLPKSSDGRTMRLQVSYFPPPMRRLIIVTLSWND